jgi:hypothetical protein
MRHAWWFVRGMLCRWLGHVPVDTASMWVAELGPQICRYCWERQEVT